MASKPQSQQSDPVLASYRKSIDNIDAALIHMLAERFRITQAVGEYKVQAGLPASDPGREALQIERLRALAIVRDVAQIYGGSVALEESEDLGGLLARLRLPLAG